MSVRASPLTTPRPALVRPGRSAIVPFKPKRKFIAKLGKAKVILAKQTLQVGAATPKATFRRLPIRLSGTKKSGKHRTS